MNKFVNRIARFEKVSYDQFKKDWLDTFAAKNHWCEVDWNKKYNSDELNSIIQNIYDNVKLPTRATSKSAGYDFFSPANLVIEVNNTIKIPTGIRCEMDNGWVLKEYPRSGHGFKFGVHMANTVGIIDADYFNNQNNEGHIFIKLINDSVLAKPIELKSGDAFCQGIFVPFGITVDDDVIAVRRGGFGSTD